MVEGAKGLVTAVWKSIRNQVDLWALFSPPSELGLALLERYSCRVGSIG